METFSLFELNEHIRRVIALNFQDSLWVKAEIAQVRQSRGHYYLELIEKAPSSDEIVAQIPAVIWSKNAWIIQRKLRDVFSQILQDGMEIRLKVRVDFHERFGLKLMIEDLDPSYTLGNIEARRREIIATLYAEGLVDRNAGLSLPMVMQRIAVLSAENAAGYQDFRKHILYHPSRMHFTLDLFPVAVQGAYVERQVTDALDRISRVAHHYDCIAIIRGGGSRLDLSAFDSLAIGKAIAHAPLPVFTGIGHETDRSVADVVAHTALKTPTAVADFILEHNMRFAARVEELFAEINALVLNQLNAHQVNLNHIIAMLNRVSREFVTRRKLVLQQMVPAFGNAYRQHLQKHRDRLTYLDSMLDTLNPENLLRRGFSITSINGRRIISSEGVKTGDTVTTYLFRGKIESTVTSHE